MFLEQRLHCSLRYSLLSVAFLDILEISETGKTSCRLPVSLISFRSSAIRRLRLPFELERNTRILDCFRQRRLFPFLLAFLCAVVVELDLDLASPMPGGDKDLFLCSFWDTRTCTKSFRLLTGGSPPTTSLRSKTSRFLSAKQVKKNAFSKKGIS